MPPTEPKMYRTEAHDDICEACYLATPPEHRAAVGYTPEAGESCSHCGAVPVPAEDVCVSCGEITTASGTNETQCPKCNPTQHAEQ